MVLDNSLSLYAFNKPYFGNISQPDTMTVFVTSDAATSDTAYSVYGRSKHHIANVVGYFPLLSTFTGVVRIVSATIVIFKELSQMKLNQNNEKNECWNGFKHLFRGLIEIVPLIGNISLLVFDKYRAAYFFSKVEASIKETKKPRAGIALDGEIIFDVDLKIIKRLENKVEPQTEQQPAIHSDLKRLYTWEAFTVSALEKFEEKTKKSVLLEYALAAFPDMLAQLATKDDADVT